VEPPQRWWARQTLKPWLIFDGRRLALTHWPRKTLTIMTFAAAKRSKRPALFSSDTEMPSIPWYLDHGKLT
jgi:hypothetical protein